MDMPKTITIEVPENIDEGILKSRIEKVIDFTVSNDLDKFMEAVELYGLLKIEEESFKEFLKEEPDIYDERDIKRYACIFFLYGSNEISNLYPWNTIVKA